MTAIEKAKTLEFAIKLSGMSGRDDYGLCIISIEEALDFLTKALAALEAEKPAEDAIDVVERIYELYGDMWTKKSIEVLQQYAEAFHAKRCAECRK